MKAVAGKTLKTSSDFYLSTLAPVNRPGALRFGYWDVAMLSVLFLEVGVLMRSFLAN
ncbi:MAG TPA: hypothetical protein VFD66_00205 [Verrucomicrobiae bacterium]|nr:hypothetical protein [Verrucomicrobiae bacterium]